jgi:hypothetical protein
MIEISFAEVQTLAWGMYPAARITILAALARFRNPTCRRYDDGTIKIEEDGRAPLVVSREFFRG